jgi:glycerate-2-kinase
VVGSARLSLEGAANTARGLGYSVVTRADPIVGEARVAAREHVDWVRRALETDAGRSCVLSSGETTVTVTGMGRGGRNQEFVLAMAAGLAAQKRGLTAGSIGTDGIDGPTDAAGAVADETTIARAERAGLNASRALDDNDSWAFFSGLGDAIVTGPTGTNVGDIQIVLADRAERS